MGKGDERLRARDVDRVSTMSVLDDALVDGQLGNTEHRNRVEQAKAAVTLTELTSLTDDLQRSPAAPLGPGDRRRRLTPRVTGGLVAVLVVVLAVVVATGVVRGPGSDDNAEPVPSDSLVAGPMFTADGIREVVDATRSRFGTTVVEGIHLYRDNAVLHVVDPKSPTGSTHYDYSPGGEFHNPQVYSGLSVNSTGSSQIVVDLAKVDADKVAALIASSPEKLRITAAQAGQAPFRVTIGGDDGGEIWMGVNDISLDSHLVAGLDGHIKGVHPCGWGC